MALSVSLTLSEGVLQLLSSFVQLVSAVITVIMVMILMINGTCLKHCGYHSQKRRKGHGSLSIRSPLPALISDTLVTGMVSTVLFDQPTVWQEALEN